MAKLKYFHSPYYAYARGKRVGPRPMSVMESIVSGCSGGSSSRRNDDAAAFAAVGALMVIFPVVLALDTAFAIRDGIKLLRDPDFRADQKVELRRYLAKLRRPFYYARENKRRRQFAAERRKLHRRTTLNREPTAAEFLAAWEARKESKAAMIRLGGMLHDLECFVDNTLRLTTEGVVVGRNRGIKGWINANVPELNRKYKTLMRYKAMAVRVRQATGLRDPRPTDSLLTKPEENEVTRAILEDERNTFASILEVLEDWLDPERVFAREIPDHKPQPDPPKARRKRRR